jgi:hypothetical protein
MKASNYNPRGLTLNAQYRAIASAYGFGDALAEYEFEIFVDYHRSMESERSHWPTTWRAWLKEAGRREEAARQKRPAPLPSDYALTDEHRKVAIEVVTKFLGERPSEEGIRAQFDKVLRLQPPQGKPSGRLGRRLADMVPGRREIRQERRPPRQMAARTGREGQMTTSGDPSWLDFDLWDAWARGIARRRYSRAWERHEAASARAYGRPLRQRVAARPRIPPV